MFSLLDVCSVWKGWSNLHFYNEEIRCELLEVVFCFYLLSGKISFFLIQFICFLFFTLYFSFGFILLGYVLYPGILLELFRFIYLPFLFFVVMCHCYIPGLNYLYFFYFFRFLFLCSSLIHSHCFISLHFHHFTPLQLSNLIFIFFSSPQHQVILYWDLEQFSFIFRDFVITQFSAINFSLATGRPSMLCKCKLRNIFHYM